MPSEPLVSCIMPTYDRRRFVPLAIRYFLRQDYPRRELLVVDDGTDPVADLMPEDPRIRYLRLPHRHSVGAKRNLACREAHGTLVVHWDDDDWSAPGRIRSQVETLLRTETDICGLDRILFYAPDEDRAWQYVYPRGGRAWVYGGTLCYTKAFWQNHPFPDTNVGEDSRFVWTAPSERIAALPDNRSYVALIHPANTSPKRRNGSRWHPHPADEVHGLLSTDLSFYRPGHVHPADPAPPAFPSPTSHRSPSMLTIAREADLSLPEYAAYNSGQTLPRMRRWELPFALFQARLSNTMAVLDCTINPAGFQERLSNLYRHVLYRHWNPVQNGRFVLPLGVPDEGFDRVFCVNTLEHLLRPQREALLAEMARKLKPGGLLILTSDAYFDSFWENPVLLEMGVLRADRAEIFNGWNRVTAQEWVASGAGCGLHPLAEEAEVQAAVPREEDATLYRNLPPYPHACIGGVFYKAPQPVLPEGKKVVLALLTWNTCSVSLDSVRAYLQEAYLLRRLGHHPSLCLCDNGSKDGTVEALRALASEADVPCRLLLNRENVGNSVARNQIIDHMLDEEADYLLFMDGDIEVVPFSSVAILRYLEDSGHRLGCIGADSSGQTPYRQQASPCWYHIDPARTETTNLVAWTQYGMFRRAVFEDGVRFDESEPFQGAGWGFEDNDLAFQMELKGYLNQRFFGMVYLHRAARSSIRIMREHGFDPQALYARRKQYVIDKWASVPPINDGPLRYVRRVMMQV